MKGELLKSPCYCNDFRGINNVQCKIVHKIDRHFKRGDV